MILRLKDLPIRVKIVGTFTAILLFTSIFNMVYFPASEKEQVNRALEDRAGSMVQMLAAGMESALGTGDYEFVNQLFEMVRTDPNIVYVVVVDQAGEPSISFNPHEAQQLPKQDYAGRDMLEKGGILHSRAPLQIEEGIEGELVMGWSLEERDEQLARIRMTSVVVSVVVFIAGIIVFLVLSRLITEPIRNLVTATEQIVETGAYDGVADNESADEVGVLVGAFNAMVARQKQADEEKQQRTRALEQEINERLRAETELQFRNLVLLTQLESTIDGIVVVDEEREWVCYNRQFIDMWGIPPEIEKARNSALALQSVLDRVVGPCQGE